MGLILGKVARHLSRPMRSPYLYAGLEASLYDQLDELSDFSDLPFYQRCVESAGGSTLDVGCGTGRTLLPLAADGFALVGLDYSERMLEICREKLAEAGLVAELAQGDMRAFELGDVRFSTVMIPGFSVQLLQTAADLRRCLTCCRRHLAIDGQLIVSTYMPWSMIWDERDTAPLAERKRVKDPNTGETRIAWQGWAIDSHRQKLTLHNRLERRGRDGDLLEAQDASMALSWKLPHEMMRLLNQAGFGEVDVYGDFEFGPVEDDSESLVYIARPVG